jgi:hypothetical protein
MPKRRVSASPTDHGPYESQRTGSRRDAHASRPRRFGGGGARGDGTARGGRPRSLVDRRPRPCLSARTPVDEPWLGDEHRPLAVFTGGPGSPARSPALHDDLRGGEGALPRCNGSPDARGYPDDRRGDRANGPLRPIRVRWRLPNDRRVPTPGSDAVAAVAREAAERYHLQAEQLEALAADLEV